MSPLQYVSLYILIDQSHVYTTFFYTYNSKRFIKKHKNYLFLWRFFPFLSFCFGIQNSTCAIATVGFLPTNMTGLSTDVGINFTRYYFNFKGDQNLAKQQIKKNNIRICILVSFISGGVISSFILLKTGTSDLYSHSNRRYAF